MITIAMVVSVGVEGVAVPKTGGRRFRRGDGVERPLFPIEHVIQSRKGVQHVRVEGDRRSLRTAVDKPVIVVSATCKEERIQ